MPIRAAVLATLALALTTLTVAQCVGCQPSPSPRGGASGSPSNPSSPSLPPAASDDQPVEAPPAPRWRPGPTAADIAAEPRVRVRLQANVTQVQITGPDRVQVATYPFGEEDQMSRGRTVTTPLTVRRVGHRWVTPWQGQPGQYDVLVVEPAGSSPLQIDQARYPGEVRLVPAPVYRDQRPGMQPAGPREGWAGGFDVVSLVGIETYLPGVLERELYPNFGLETYRSQAIVARSYAIARAHQRGPEDYFDVEATTASQVYGGESTRAIARRAAADTAGRVLTWENRVFTAYYSSTCGGVGQGPRDAFPAYHGDDVPPLQPRTRHTWCEISPRYRWGPVQRDRADLSRRIAAWGRTNRVAIGRIGTIDDIQIAERNQLGRPVRFRLTDDSGRAFGLRADSLRHASNYADERADLHAFSGDDIVRSGHFNIAMRGNSVYFTNGQGFGHGVGLCQFGAEGMAQAGRTHRQILADAYPGAQIERAY